jgi:hypothetical protein
MIKENAMGHVINVDFSTKRNQIDLDYPWAEFEQMLKDNGICEEDISEIADSVRDFVTYQEADQDIQKIADVYISNVYR